MVWKRFAAGAFLAQVGSGVSEQSVTAEGTPAVGEEPTQTPHLPLKSQCLCSWIEEGDEQRNENETRQ
jgi:hypothetical protein